MEEIFQIQLHKDVDTPLYQRRHQSGTHTGEILKLLGLVKDREVGKLHRALQHKVDLFTAKLV